MNTETRASAPIWCRAAIVVLCALVLVMTVLFLRVRATYLSLEDTVETLCGDTILAAEEELRSEDPQLTAPLYEFYEITRIYPSSSYASLAKALLVLEDPQVLAALTEEDRTLIADGLHAFSQNESSAVMSDYLEEITALLDEAAGA